MKTSEFLDLLAQHKEKSLVFEYLPGRMVGANYHITEVKHTTIDSVDCGTGTDSWNETIIQLWESPNEAGKTEYLSVYKAFSILKKVGRIKAFDLDAEVKFEYGNANFHTAQLFVDAVEVQKGELIMKLAVTKTDCKAKDACGIPEPVEMGEKASSCDPNSGCC